MSKPHITLRVGPVRTLVVIALACSVFGGVIGALATAATQSQARPTAVTASIGVQDQAVRRELVRIFQRLGQTNSRLSDVNAQAKKLNTAANAIRGDFTYAGASVGRTLMPDIARDVRLICDSAHPNVSGLCR